MRGRWEKDEGRGRKRGRGGRRTRGGKDYGEWRVGKG
jgi:hypothetical protein